MKYTRKHTQMALWKKRSALFFGLALKQKRTFSCKAVMIPRFGGPDVLQIRSNEKLPKLGSIEVIVATHAATVNPLYVRIREGYGRSLFESLLPVIPGRDVNGERLVVGNQVKHLHVGQEVYRALHPTAVRGTYSDYAVLEEDQLVLKPASLTHMQAAAIPFAAAWQALKGKPFDVISEYPLLMAVWKVAPALAAGYTAVLKPSELASVTCLEQDTESKVACETCAKTNMVMIFGEITTKADEDYEKIVRNTCREIGFICANVGLDADHCKVLVQIEQQSPDIAQGVHGHFTKKLEEIGAGDQDRMFGYATDEDEKLIPLGRKERPRSCVYCEFEVSQFGEAARSIIRYADEDQDHNHNNHVSFVCDESL